MRRLHHRHGSSRGLLADPTRSTLHMESGSNSSSTLPRLSANESRRTPTLSSSVRWRLASGVGFSIADVPAAPHLAGRTAGDEDRQVRVIMKVGIAHPAAVEVERVVQERAVPLGCGLQLREELGEQRHMELVDLGHPGDLCGVVAVVRERVVRVGDADLGIGPRAGFAGELEGDHPGDVP